MQQSDSPVFIVASERSGTNLLRKRLTENQNVYFGPPAAHFLKHLYYHEPYYGDLEDDHNFEVFIQQALDLCLIHFAPWDIDWTPTGIIKDFGNRSRDAIQLMDYMMQRYAREQGFERYICKDNFLYEFSIDIAASIPSAKFIFLYRDPRDFVLSQTNRPENNKSPHKYAQLWHYEQTKAIATSLRLNRHNKCLFVSYEELISNETETIAKLLDFLNVQKTTNTYYKENIVEHVKEWENLNKPTNSKNSQKFIKEMAIKDILAVESICKNQMRFLGYELITPANRKPSKIALLKSYIIGLIKKKMSRIKRPKNSIYYERSKVLNRVMVNYRTDR